jgi:hypothetical protein
MTGALEGDVLSEDLQPGPVNSFPLLPSSEQDLVTYRTPGGNRPNLWDHPQYLTRGGWTRETAAGTSQPELLADPQPIDTTLPSPVPVRPASPRIVHLDSS